MSDLLTKLTFALSENELTIPEGAAPCLIRYLALLETWNRVFNLTAITAPSEMISLHLIDSLLVMPFCHGTHHLDVGSGGGLPGIPLAIALPQTKWVLLDKNSKKTRFLTQAIAELPLTNARAIQANVSEFHPPENFDSIVSRAFGTIQLFVETTAHLLSPHGRLIAMKGQYPANELATLPEGFEVEKVVRLHIKGMELERHLVLIRKTS